MSARPIREGWLFCCPVKKVLAIYSRWIYYSIIDNATARYPQMEDLQQQIDAAYARNDKAEIIRLGSLMGDIAAANFKPSEPVRTGAWRNVCTESVQKEYALESRILARDERATMDF